MDLVDAFHCSPSAAAARLTVNMDAREFQNLYFLDNPSFRNHNFQPQNFIDSYRLKPFEPVDEQGIQFLMACCIDANPDELTPSPPQLVAFTLSSPCYEALRQSNPSLPITDRDYYLSKLFQFIEVALNARFVHKDMSPLESNALRDEIDSDLMSNLSMIPDDLARRSEVLLRIWHAACLDARRMVSLWEVLKRFEVRIRRYLYWTSRASSFGAFRPRERAEARSLGQLIRSARKLAGWPQPVLAAKLGLKAYRQVIDWEKDRAIPQDLESLSSVLGIPLDTLRAAAEVTKTIIRERNKKPHTNLTARATTSL